LPAAFRREAPDQRFVLIQAYRPSLALYPEAEWAAVQERLEELIRHQPEARMYVLSLVSRAVEVRADGQGRILITASLQAAAQLDGRVRLVGALDKVAVWNPDVFESAVAEAESGFEPCAPQIFR